MVTVRCERCVRVNFKIFLTAILMASVLFLVFTQQQPVAASNDNVQPSLNMPIEHVNYTITTVNGSLWAKIDGNYPIYNSGFDVLPMVYPTPPGTTNISLKLDGALVSWSNYTEFSPEDVHHTGIGDWSMIYAVLDNVPDFFVLEIHYEHPIQVINGSYAFLYDLNIKDYLSASANQSIAYFNVKMDINFTDLKVQTISLDESLHPINYTITNEYPREISVQTLSEYGKPLLGDLLFSFNTTASQKSDDQQSPLILSVIVAVVGASLVAGFGYIFYRLSKKTKKNR